MTLSRIQFIPVSPFLSLFDEYIDIKIRDLVLTFVKKGYLPVSSCQGHQLIKPRYIDLAFGNPEQRSLFLQHCEQFKSKSAVSYTKSETLSTEIAEGRLVTWQSRESEINGLNQLFLRSYTEYCFLRIIIGKVLADQPSNLPFRMELKLHMKMIYVGVHNFIFRERATLLYLKDLVLGLPDFQG